jgi:Mrp family chromosome partitioning ATPase
VLPAGSPNGNISHLLYSARLPKLLERFREEFDAVLIDSPPMLQAPDARILARVAGAVVLVIRAGHTSRDTAVAAKQRFIEDGTPLIGTILNDWNLKSASGPSYRKYYSRNGHSDGNGNRAG